MDSNEYSVVLHVTSGEFSVLLTGDIEGQGEQQLSAALVSNGMERVDVLKVAHHGSRYSTSKVFLKGIDVGVAIISCGEGNVYGHPHEETLKRLEEDDAVVLTTPERGAIRIEFTRKHGIIIKCFAQEGVSPP